MSNLNKAYDVIVIGAGVIGASIVYHLSELKKYNVLLIEQDYPMAGTSGATHACVNVHSKIPASYGEFSYYSAELYSFLERKIGDFEYRRTGSVHPFFSEDDRDKALRLQEEQEKVGIRVDVLTRDEVLEKIPDATEELLGATFSPLDGHLNPFRLIELYLQAAKRTGLSTAYYHQVVDFKQANGGYHVFTNKGSFYSKYLVLAAGPWMKQLGKLLHIDIPIRQMRGQLLVTEPLQPILNYALGSMHQTENGEILIGYSREEVGLNRDTTLDMIQKTAAMAQYYLPSLSNTKIVRSFAGIRPVPEDGLPILGEVPNQENLYIAATHSGVTLSPLVGTLITELLAQGETSLPLNNYHIERFS